MKPPQEVEIDLDASSGPPTPKVDVTLGEAGLPYWSGERSLQGDGGGVGRAKNLFGGEGMAEAVATCGVDAAAEPAEPAEAEEAAEAAEAEAGEAAALGEDEAAAEQAAGTAQEASRSPELMSPGMSMAIAMGLIGHQGEQAVGVGEGSEGWLSDQSDDAAPGDQSSPLRRPTI